MRARACGTPGRVRPAVARGARGAGGGTPATGTRARPSRAASALGRGSASWAWPDPMKAVGRPGSGPDRPPHGRAAAVISRDRSTVRRGGDRRGASRLRTTGSTPRSCRYARGGASRRSGESGESGDSPTRLYWCTHMYVGGETFSRMCEGGVGHSPDSPDSPANDPRRSCGCRPPRAGITARQSASQGRFHAGSDRPDCPDCRLPPRPKARGCVSPPGGHAAGRVPRGPRPSGPLSV